MGRGASRASSLHFAAPVSAHHEASDPHLCHGHSPQLASLCVEPCILFSPKYLCVPALTSKSAGQGSLFTGVLGGRRYDKCQMLRCLLVFGYCRKVDFFLSLPGFLSQHPFPPLPKEAGLNDQSFSKHLVTSLSTRDCAGCIGRTVLEHLVPAIRGFIVKWGVARSFQGDGGANTGCSWDHGRQI